MSAAYVTAKPAVRVEGEVLWLEFRSGDETITLALTRNAAAALLEGTRRQILKLFDDPTGIVIPIAKAARKPRAKAVRS